MPCEICKKPASVLVQVKVVEDGEIVQKDVCPGCFEEMTL